MSTLPKRSFMAVLCLTGMLWVWNYQTSTISPCVMGKQAERQDSNQGGDNSRCAGLFVLVVKPGLTSLGDFAADRATPVFAALTALATVVIAWFTVALSNETKRMQTVADEQRKEMELARGTMIEANNISRASLSASQRAWLRPRVSIVGPLVYDPKDTPPSKYHLP